MPYIYFHHSLSCNSASLVSTKAGNEAFDTVSFSSMGDSKCSLDHCGCHAASYPRKLDRELLVVLSDESTCSYEATKEY